jgi:hypothetical protein
MIYELLLIAQTQVLMRSPKKYPQFEAVRSSNWGYFLPANDLGSWVKQAVIFLRECRAECGTLAEKLQVN